MLEYEELRIRVRRVSAGRYLIVANGPTSGADVIVVDGRLADYWDRFNQLIETELGRIPTGATHVATKLRELGRDLFDLLLPQPLVDCVTESLHRAQSQRPPRGLRLRFDLPPELRDLPVEALTSPAADPQQSLALNHNLSLVRSLKGDPPGARIPDAAAEPDFIHLLVAVASPTDAGLRQLDPSAELAKLQDELPAVTFRMTVARATRRRIEEWLGDHADRPAVVLLIAHGDYDDARGEGVVYLETEDSSADRIPGHLLSGLLMRAQQLRLVVLNLCSGARSARSEPFSGLAQALIGRGIPAVVAMQDQVTDIAATLFSPALLECISSNKTIDEAVSTARQRVTEIPGHTAIEWTIPTLFLHDAYSHGWLFKAREVRDEDDEMADPLRDGDDALQRYRGSTGNVNPATVVAAARCLRARGDWQEVRRVAQTQHPSPEQRWLVQEAEVELVWPQIEQLCAVMAEGGDPGGAGSRLVAELCKQSLPGLASCLAGELEEFELAQIYAAAHDDLRSENWAEATGWYEQILGRRPAGYRDTSRLADYARGRAAEVAENWAVAGEAYGRCAGVDDAAARLAYAEGRRAELAGEWPQAIERYASTQHADAVVRAEYARGRACERAQEWEQARTHYATLPPRLFDIVHRLLYVTGRLADQRADYPSAIEGFGRLPDGYEDGDVGNRRRFARAWIAGQKSEWGSVLAHLDGLPDDDRGGAVGLLRRKARGRQAELAGNWHLAVEEYAPVADTDEEVRRLHRYALGRAAEDGQDWAEALNAYAELPTEHQDAFLRRAYAQARLTDQEASDTVGWRRAVAAYAHLPAGFEDASMRAGRARAKLAESTEDWPDAAREAETVGGYLDVHLLGHYAQGRLAERAEAWQEAAQAYRRCVTYLDAAGREPYVIGRALESSGQWSAAIESYQHSDLTEADDRRRRLTRLREALPWADGLTSAGLVADPCALRDPTFPYLALRDAGVNPGSPTDVVMNAPYALMERDRMTVQERMAWNQLRLPDKRMQIDALLYQFRDFRRFRDQLAQLRWGDPQELLDELCRRLPDDAALLILLIRGRDEAIAEWEQRLRSSPGDMAVAHCLAVAHFWSAQELEESGAWELAGLAWERALACWAALLTEDDHWIRWRQERAACYQHMVSAADTDRLRWELGKILFDRLSGYAERHGEQERPEHAQTHQALIHYLERELEGAQALKEAGGLPLPGATGTTLICGPAYLRGVELEAALGELVARLEVSARDGADPGEPALRRLRCAFSELAQAFAFSQRHRFEQALWVIPDAWHKRALAELPADCSGATGHGDEHLLACAHCQDFLRNNPAYTYLPHRRARLLQDGVDLAVRAHLAIARAALTGGAGGLDRAVEQWALAIQISGPAAMPVRTKDAILRMVLGRAEVLADDEGAERGICLDQAIALVESAVPLLGGRGREPLMAKLAVLLTSRGVWHGYGCRDFGFQPDMELAGGDLRRAMELNPESARTRDYLARTLIFGSAERPGADTYRGKLRRLEKAIAILDDGLNRARSPRLLDTLKEALWELQSLLLKDLSISELGRWIKESGSDSGDSTARATELFDAAQRKLRDDDVTGTLRDLVRATRLNPVDEQLRRTLRALLDTINRESNNPQDDGSADK